MKSLGAVIAGILLLCLGGCAGSFEPVSSFFRSGPWWRAAQADGLRTRAREWEARNELGLALFSGAAFVQAPLTADFNTTRSFLNAAGPQSISRPGTALEEALRVALDGFAKEIASNRVILLLTDGEGHEGDPQAAAQAAAEAGVTIYAIGFGSPVGEPIPVRDADSALLGYKKDAQGDTVLSRLDETTLQQIVDATGGRYFRASAGGDEIGAISGAIAALDTGETESQFETHGVERFEWFAGLALLALTAEFLIGARIKR